MEGFPFDMRQQSCTFESIDIFQFFLRNLLSAKSDFKYVKSLGSTLQLNIDLARANLLNIISNWKYTSISLCPVKQLHILRKEKEIKLL